MVLVLVALFALMIKIYIKRQNYLEAGEDHLQHLMNQKVQIKDLMLKFLELIMTLNIYFLILVIIFYHQKFQQHLH
jgi:mannose/fructose/N-acetylgalactosamine-specific phosphotransferase system component IID